MTEEAKALTVEEQTKSILNAEAKIHYASHPADIEQGKRTLCWDATVREAKAENKQLRDAIQEFITSFDESSFVLQPAYIATDGSDGVARVLLAMRGLVRLVPVKEEEPT